ncbi:hypothetical protein GOB18_07865 [Sinorhizobium meliloti]|nr:hypothetical protein [Sinorhizobium meliloti]MDW9453681.1 hypothetical protein [Sinorhizobium meliloti]
MVAGSLATILIADGAAALEFVFRPAAGTGQTAIDGFNAAGNLWVARLSDPVKLVIDIDFRPLDPGVLGETASEALQASYIDFRAAIADDKTSADDASHNNMPQSLSILLNRTQNSVHGAGSDDLYSDSDGDANNTTIRINRANAKALRILAADDPAPDASITFSSDFRWDFDPSDGIEPNSFSFIAVAAHEIGHALGFVSGVDILDLNSAPAGPFFRDDQLAFVTGADTLRISAESVAQGLGVIDWAADQRVKYFALGAPTNVAGGFSTGRQWGDGQQASHWKDDLGLGLMDPTVAPGEHPVITALDLRLLDIIGYDLTPSVNAAHQLSVAGNQGESMATSSPRVVGAVAGQTVDSQTVQAAPNAPALAFSTSPDVPVLELRYEGGLIKNPDPMPFVRVYGDGQVKVHYPTYHVKAGDYSVTLSPEELKALLRIFARQELINTEQLDINAARPPANTVEQSPLSLPNDHGVVSSVTISAQSITPAGARAPQLLEPKKLSIPNTAVKAAARSGNTVLQGFAAGIEELEALSQRPGLVRQ